MKINISILQSSSFSESIYSHEPPQDLIESIKERGVLLPIWITKDNIIISGHRRVNACKLLGIEEIEAEIREYFDELVIEANRYREKTATEKWNEGKAIETIEEQKAKERQGIKAGFSQVKETFPEHDRGQTRDKIAEKLGMSGKTWEKLNTIGTEKPELLKDIDTGKESINLAYKKIEKENKHKNRQADLKQKAKRFKDSNAIQLLCGDFREVSNEIKDASVDLILTDPPYPKEYLNLFEDIAKVSKRILKPNALLLLMIGQSYLPEILSVMIPHIKYHWMVAYLTPGGQSVQLWQRKVNTFWKPILVFVNGDKFNGKWIGDVVKSAVNDNDKRFHEWGQSESGTNELIEKFSTEGDLIVDLFLGGGTSAVISHSLKRRFIGIDINKENIEITKGRIATIC